MSLLRFWTGERETDDSMARASKPIDQQRIDALAEELRASMSDASAFGDLLTSIYDDKSLSAAEVIGIARQLLGSKPKSRKAAVTDIAQERLRLSHAKAKGERAAKTKLW